MTGNVPRGFTAKSNKMEIVLQWTFDGKFIAFDSGKNEIWQVGSGCGGGWRMGKKGIFFFRYKVTGSATTGIRALGTWSLRVYSLNFKKVDVNRFTRIRTHVYTKKRTLYVQSRYNGRKAEKAGLKPESEPVSFQRVLNKPPL